ncbi:DUF4435 domain-containing protein [Hyphobacterium marinum]|uniref:DUF4435 domain-containing protein n=1 Tax=Hyphobacterium marinum TaxID=3116574 RepID=A0ABU7M0Z6_9PROT|nr:DUF4435 domain-containing protein [Hyphobacterium sp. Y6023]MEE2567440.1 DUF4435 domain-containing protein [Hyphobacterium sp. Y6023]
MNADFRQLHLEARHSPQSLVQDLASRTIGVDFYALFVEGDVDAIFYARQLRLYSDRAKSVKYVCGGKGAVLKCYHLATKVISNSDNCLYFVDRDYNIEDWVKDNGCFYITPYYSVEYFICNMNALSGFLTDHANLDDHQVDALLDGLSNLETVANLTADTRALLYIVALKVLRNLNPSASIDRIRAVDFGGINEAGCITGRRTRRLTLKKQIGICGVEDRLPTITELKAEMSTADDIAIAEVLRGKHFSELLYNLILERARALLDTANDNDRRSLERIRKTSQVEFVEQVLVRRVLITDVENYFRSRFIPRSRGAD